MEFYGKEDWNDGGDKLKDFDYITRRYLQFCQHTNYDIEDYIPGLIQDELDEHYRVHSLERKGTTSP